MASNYSVKGLEDLRGLVSTFITNTPVLLFTCKIDCNIISIWETKAFPAILYDKSKSVSRSI